MQLGVWPNSLTGPLGELREVLGKRSECHCWRRSSSYAFSMRWQEAAGDDPDEVDPGSALLAAMRRPGGQAHALRHLKSLLSSCQDPLRFVSTEQLNTVLRAGRRFDEFAGIARPDFGEDGWSTGVDDESGIWFAYRAERGAECMHVVLVRDIQGVDAVRAAAGYCATHLFPRHSPDVESCTVIDQAVDRGLWNQHREHSDDIVQVDLVNALDEPLAAIVVMICPQPDGSPDFPAAAVPAASRPARARTDKQCMTFTPLPGGAVRMHVAVLAPLGHKCDALELQRLPRARVAAMLRPLIAAWPKSFEAFLRGHKEELAHFEAFSAQAPFFAVCRGYLTGAAGPKRASLRQWGVVSRGFPRSWADGR